MPMICRVCSHKERATINAALRGGCDTYRHIAAEYGISTGSLRRHKRDHVPAILRAGASLARQDEAAAAELVVAEREAEPASLVARSRELYQQARAILDEAREGSDGRLACIALDRLAKLLSVEGMAIQAAEARGGEGTQQVRITWHGEPCLRCGFDPLAPGNQQRPPAGEVQPLAVLEPAEGLESPLAHSASKLNGQG